MISLQSLYSCLPDQKILTEPEKMIHHSFELYENIPKEVTLFDKVVSNIEMDNEMKKVSETASVDKNIPKVSEIMKRVNSRENISNFVFHDKFIDSNIELNGVYDRNVMKFDSFFMSLMSLIMDDFLYLDMDVKKNLVVQLRTKIASQLVEKDLYKKFGYDLNSKVSKRRLQQQLMDFKKNSDLSVYLLLGQFLSDYFQIDIVIFREESKSIKYFIASQFNNEVGDIPFVCIYQSKDNYYIAMKTGDKSIFKWNDGSFNIQTPSRINVEIIREEKRKQKEIEEIDDIDVNDSVSVNKLLEKDLRKLKLDDLKKLLIDRNISLIKQSEKTKKDIKKTKQDMIDNLVNL